MAEDWHFEMSKLNDLTLTDAVQIILYHTHNAETYLPTDGVSKRAGENAGVSTAADVFQQALEQKYGLRTLHSKVLHDYPLEPFLYQFAGYRQNAIGGPSRRSGSICVHRVRALRPKIRRLSCSTGRQLAKT